MAKIMSRKKACLIGIGIGGLILLIGLLMAFGVIPVFERRTTFNDNGTGAFGADFYTYVNNNAALANYNIIELGKAVGKVCGIFMACFGTFEVCFFLVAFLDKESLKSSVEDKANAVAVGTEVVVEEFTNAEETSLEVQTNIDQPIAEQPEQ